MREAKFRGKRIDTGEWAYGHYSCRSIYGDPPTHRISLTDKDGVYHDLIIDPVTLGEHTSLKDKAGKEVYEDDLVKDRLGRIGHVLFENGSYHLRNIHGTFLLSSFASEGEVIGNRHDTPELLERSSDARQIPN